MGCFDSVYFSCPNCSAEIKVQSKAGDCSLYRIPPDAVPLAIADDITGECVRCPKCGQFYTITMGESRTVSLRLT